MNVLPNDFFRSAFANVTAEHLDHRSGSDVPPVGASISELTADAIEQMTNDELIQAIRVSKLPTLLRPDFLKHLPYFDRQTLVLLTLLARRGSRNQGIEAPLTRLDDGKLEYHPQFGKPMVAKVDQAFRSGYRFRN